jgi:hypothetical protein
MPTQHTAAQDESFCSVAVRHGFKNCQKVRDANPSIKDRQLRPGDVITVPDITEKTVDGATDQQHKFKRLGIPLSRIFFIQDQNRATPEAAVASDLQRNLAVSNYVPTRQGTGFTTADWVDHTVFAHNAAASADPDHFKVQVHDEASMKKGKADIKIKLQARKPKLNAAGQVEAIEDMTEAGTNLEVTCKQVAGGSPWYRSHYLRLVIDTQDQTAKRPHGRNDTTVDAGADVSKQTLVVPTTTDKRVEILDLTVAADHLYPNCSTTAPAAQCRARAVAGVGKDEKVLRIKVFRIGGQATTTITDAQVDTMVFTNYRLTLAQANLGVELVDNRIFDVPLPQNMITVSDFDGVKAKGGGTMDAVVRLASGSATASISTSRKDTPEETAQTLASAITRLGAVCRVSPNPPVQNSSEDFGSCDIFVFNPDNTPARILSTTSTDDNQTLTHTGGWGTFVVGANPPGVASATEQYAARPNGDTDAQMVGSQDYRAAAKQFNTGTDHLAVLLVKDFASPTLLGEALIPCRDVVARLRPLRENSMAVFLDRGGAVRRTVLTHEAGHVLLDAFHTTSTGTNAEPDFDGNVYDNNAKLAYSEWMAGFSRETSPFIHKRMSDQPLTVKYAVIKAGVNNLQAEVQTLGGARPSPVERFRTLSSFVLGPLRALEPAPGANL